MKNTHIFLSLLCLFALSSLWSNPDSSASSSPDATQPPKNRTREGLFLTLPKTSYECLCVLCKTYVSEKTLREHIEVCKHKPRKKTSQIQKKTAPVSPPSITITPIDLSSPTQSIPSTPAAEILNIKKLLKRAEHPSVFAEIDARGPFRRAPLIIPDLPLQEELSHKSLKRPCQEPIIIEE